MFDGDAPFINEQFFAERVTPAQLDLLLAQGWRHFGSQFFRYSYGFYELDVRLVIPLRIRIADFSLSKSQRRTLRQNTDLTPIVRPINVTSDAEYLFHVHKRRFKSGVPDSLYDFLSRHPASEPCGANEIAVYESDKLIAASYFDVGTTANSGIYAMFDPQYASRRLGIYTLLREIEIASESGKEFYYLGYAYEGSSFYDYKKQFRGSEWFDWAGNWRRFEVQL
jgi:arginyl-tRNA--protein-N-Asp/Glu arginylyltransferase